MQKDSLLKIIVASGIKKVNLSEHVNSESLSKSNDKKQEVFKEAEMKIINEITQL
jgi:deoxycytidylate deaminase